MSLRARVLLLFAAFATLVALAVVANARGGRRILVLLNLHTTREDLLSQATSLRHSVLDARGGRAVAEPAAQAALQRLDSLEAAFRSRRRSLERLGLLNRQRAAAVDSLLTASNAFRALSHRALSESTADMPALNASYLSVLHVGSVIDPDLTKAAQQKSRALLRRTSAIGVSMGVVITALVLSLWFGVIRPADRTVLALEGRALAPAPVLPVELFHGASELMRLVRAFNRILEKSNLLALQLGRSVRVTDTLFAALRAGRGVLDLDSLAHVVAEVARNATNAELAAVAIRERANQRIRFMATAGFPREACPPGVLPNGHGLLAPLVDGQSVRVDNVSRDPRSADVPSWHPSLRNLLGVPIETRAGHWGEVYVANRTDGAAFTRDEEAVLHSLATFLNYAAEQSEADAAVAAEVTLRETVNLLTGFAHEINNSVTAVRLNLQAIEEHARSAGLDRPDEWQAIMRDTVEPLDRVTALVRTVLTASGARAVPTAPAVDLASAARHAATRVQAEVPGAAPISVEAPERVSLEGPSSQHAAFVLETLTRWCARRIGEGTGRGGDVFVTVAAPDEGRVLIEVGHRSLPQPADVASIFEPTARADQRRGTVEFDLDLLLVRAAVQRAGARIEAVPLEGGAGISFRTEFPAAKAAPVA